MRLSSVKKTIGSVRVEVPWAFPAFTTASYLTPGFRLMILALVAWVSRRCDNFWPTGLQKTLQVKVNLYFLNICLISTLLLIYTYYLCKHHQTKKMVRKNVGLSLQCLHVLIWKTNLYDDAVCGLITGGSHEIIISLSFITCTLKRCGGPGSLSTQPQNKPWIFTLPAKIIHNIHIETSFKFQPYLYFL